MTRLLLHYPHGRTHEVNYEGERRFEQGEEFALFGRTWRVVGHDPRRQPPSRRGSIVMCHPVSA